MFTVRSTAARRPLRSALVVVLIVAGCSGSGPSCGSSCGGVFVTKDGDGKPLQFDGTRLSNVAQVRVTKSGFNFLNEKHLNDLLGQLNGADGGFNIPCKDFQQKDNPDGGAPFEGPPFIDLCSIPFVGTQFSMMMADSNFNDVCDPGEGAPLRLSFKSLSWTLNPDTHILSAHILAHVKTDAIYLRTREAHSSFVFCNSMQPIQARVFYDDETPGLPQQDTRLDLDLIFGTTPDGRLEINVSQDSLAAIVDQFIPDFINIDGFASGLAAGTQGNYVGDGCDTGPSGRYNVVDPNNPSNLSCSGLFRTINAGCNVNDPTQGPLCSIFLRVRDYLINYLKTTFAPQIVGLLRKQLDNARCQRALDNAGKPIACDTSHPCPNDEDGNALTCDTGRGVCFSGGDPANGTEPYRCEPIPLAITGQLNVNQLTDKVGFPAKTSLEIFAGLGSKNSVVAVDKDGLQLAARAGTSPTQPGTVAVCVPNPAAWASQDPPPLVFDDPANKPAGVSSYDVGFSLSSVMLNRGFYDAYSSGLLCVSITNKTSSFVSSGLFKTFLPSLNQLTGGKDTPMAILLRPTQPPTIRVGKGTLKQSPDGTYLPDDPLITVTFQGLNLDFYSVVDDRQARLFTLTTDLQLPLGLRTFPGAGADTLQPVLGGLDQVLTNIRAGNNKMLAEDPAVVKDLIGAAVRLAQPLIGGLLKPIQLPSMLGLDLQVQGLGGAVQRSSNVTVDGYHHLAVYAGIAECAAGACEQYRVKTQARIVSRLVPEDLDEVRGPNRSVPFVEIEAGADQARDRTSAEFSYRIDGGFWSPWVKGPRFRVQDLVFLLQGHHTIDVVAREAGDDRTQDPDPVTLDFFVSFEKPEVELWQRNDGAIVTRAHSVATRDPALQFSYRLAGDTEWSPPGPARVFGADELGGRGVAVRVFDEGGKMAQAKLGDIDLSSAARQAGGCASTGGGFGLLPFALVALWLGRRRAARILT